MTYVGRFAPSPTGRLHRGSLLSAVGSWLDARAVGGRWLVRIDDLDTPRCRVQFEHDLLATLAVFGLTADEPIRRQSQRLERYASAIEEIGKRAPLFRCDCTRRQRREQGGDEEGLCLGHCRERHIESDDCAWRADLTRLAPMQVEDRSMGVLQFDPRRHRDVVLRRRDGFYSYALAVVLDDADSAVTDVVRGADLCASTPWQLALHQALNLRVPRYLHLPLLLEADGRKLSKSAQSLPPDPAQKIEELRRCLRWLHQPEPPAQFTIDCEPATLLEWSAQHWRPEAFKGLGTQHLI